MLHELLMLVVVDCYYFSFDVFYQFFIHFVTCVFVLFID